MMRTSVRKRPHCCAEIPTPAVARTSRAFDEAVRAAVRASTPRVILLWGRGAAGVSAACVPTKPHMRATHKQTLTQSADAALEARVHVILTCNRFSLAQDFFLPSPYIALAVYVSLIRHLPLSRCLNTSDMGKAASSRLRRCMCCRQRRRRQSRR